MADLLGISVSGFLILTQTFTLPWLVLLGKADVIKKIADAREQDSNETCMDTSNMVAILPVLLIQSAPDMEKMIMSRLVIASESFKNVDFTDLIRVEPGSQAFHLLKAAGEADPNKKSRVRVTEQ